MAEHLYGVIGSRVKYFRKKIKMSQEELAKSCDLKRSSLSQIESGKQKLSIEHLYQICEALECDVFDILPSRKRNSVDAITNIRLEESSIISAKKIIDEVLRKDA